MLCKEQVLQEVKDFIAGLNLTFEPDPKPYGDKVSAYGVHWENPQSGWAIRVKASPWQYGGVDFSLTPLAKYGESDFCHMDYLRLDGVQRNCVESWVTGTVFADERKTAFDPAYLDAVRQTFENQRAAREGVKRATELADKLADEFNARSDRRLSGEEYQGKIRVLSPDVGIKLDIFTKDHEKVRKILAILNDEA